MIEISNTNAIPVMTSNTAPSGVASASTIYGVGYEAYKAFNNSKTGISDGWRTASNTKLGWIQYTFDTPKKIAKYTVTPITETTTNAPKDWTFQGSNDGVTWDVLDTQTAQVSWTASEKREFLINENLVKEYSMYKINVINNNGGTTLTINEIEMFEVVAPISKILIVSGSNGFAHNGTTWVNKGVIPGTKAERDIFFETNGMDIITKAQLSTLAATVPSGKIKIVKI